MSLEAMVSAANNGKLSEFENAFRQEITQRVAARIQDVKDEIGRSVLADGEEIQGD